MRCAPYLAIRTLHQLVEDEGARFPRGARCLRHQAFVDNIFGSADQLEEAKEERDELILLLKAAGFELDKWSTNHKYLIPEEHRTKPVNNTVHIETLDTVSALGFQWNQSSDQFSYDRKRLEQNSVCNKRTALSCLSRLFDPLGWLSPVTIVGKVFLQELWIAKVDWDEKFNESQARRWTRAYAAVVYGRSITEDEAVHVNIIAAKAKLSPIKTISIPKLELCGATLLVRLLRHYRKLDFFKDVPVTAWSDSQVTLASSRCTMELCAFQAELCGFSITRFKGGGTLTLGCGGEGHHGCLKDENIGPGKENRPLI
ncbi:uncharacterized protein [Cardiocondyla obscurior]|uniref:uncharacterized protein n=1 Tax=Cardiocondyla obscurior TaxID=286306 RepID=UPI00396562CE